MSRLKSRPVPGSTKPKEIYTVTVVSGDPNSREKETSLRSRCWGYYFNRKTAVQAVKENWTDISECGYYRYALVAAVGEGMLTVPERTIWYEFFWNHQETGDSNFPKLVEVKQIEKPEIYQPLLFGGLS